MHVATGGLLTGFTRRGHSNLTRHWIDPPFVSHDHSGLLLTSGSIAEGAITGSHFLPLPGSSSTISASTTSS
jgi:hypothetical protein